MMSVKNINIDARLIKYYDFRIEVLKSGIRELACYDLWFFNIVSY